MTAHRPLPRVERDPATGQAKFFHECREGRALEATLGAWLPTQPVVPDGWAWGPDDALTPSIHCLECDTHGVWDGPSGWRPA